MSTRLRLKPGKPLAALILATACAATAFGAGLDESLSVVSSTNRSAAESQQKIDQLSAQTRAMLEEYRKYAEGSEYQAAYTRELEELQAAQELQITALREQIEQARITRQRIVPLMRSMADALEKFVVLDLPFHQEERITGVLQLKQRLNDPGLSVAARFRLLLEAYQLEQGFGGSVEAWRGPLQFEGETLSVEYLRVGRVALYFQSLDGETTGYWDRAGQSWVVLDPQYNRPVAQALRVARNLVAPQLLQLPMAPAGEAS